MIENKKTDVESNKMYYIRNEGYVGNALIWWAEKSRGYTTDIRKAGKYTAEQTKKICQRPEDTAYECDYIDNLLEGQKLIMDAQYVCHTQRLFTND